MTDLDYAKVAGRFGLTIADTGDPGDDPDTVWCTEGTITLTPLITDPVKVIDGTDGPYQLAQAPITATINSDGRLTHNSQLFVEVPDFTSSKVNPNVGPDAATHRVSFAGVKAGAIAVTFPDFVCRLVAAGDGVSAGAINDLARVAPVSVTAPTPIVRGEPGPAGPGVVDAEIVGGDLVFTLEIGGTVNAGPVPSGSDSSVAGWVNDQDSATSGALQTAIEARDFAPDGAWAFTDAPTVDGDPLLTSVSKADVGLGSVDNTSDASKPLSTAATTALAAKADLVSGKVPSAQLPSIPNGATFPVASQSAMLALSTAVVGDFAVRSDLSNQPFRLAALPASTLANWVAFGTSPSVTSVAGKTGTVALVKGDVGLGNVDNTADTAKPVSTAAQAALNLKAPLASPAFTGTPTGLTKAHVGLSAVDNTSDASKPVSTAQLAALNLKADKTGTLRQFADVDPTVPTDGVIYVYDSTAGKFQPVDPSTLFALVDSEGRLADVSQPQWYVPQAIVNVGDPAPAGFPTDGSGIIYEKVAPPSLTPVIVATGFSTTAGATLAVTTTADLEVGDWVAIVPAVSDSNTTSSTITSVALGAGVWNRSTGVNSYQAGTAQVYLDYAKVTTRIPAGTVITFTFSQARGLRSAMLCKLPNLAAATPLDKTATNGGGSSSNLNLSVGPTAATAQASEVALMAIVNNDGTGAITRTVGGTNGWLPVGSPIEADNGTTSRLLTVVAKVLTGVAAVTGTATVTASDSVTGAWAGLAATFKGA